MRLEAIGCDLSDFSPERDECDTGMPLGLQNRA